MCMVSSSVVPSLAFRHSHKHSRFLFLSTLGACRIAITHFRYRRALHVSDSLAETFTLRFLNVFGAHLGRLRDLIETAAIARSMRSRDL
jgi:hypothetical protein